MVLYQRSKVLLFSRFLIVSAAIFSVAACFPAFQRIYQTPAVTGRVIDLESLKPIEGASVLHQSRGEKSKSDFIDKTVKDRVFTNQAGEYYLPSQSSRQLTTLMAGHAIVDYPVRISTNGHSGLVFVKASMKMLAEESTMAPLLILDQDPDTIAATPSDDYLNQKQLQVFLAPQGALGGCDLELGAEALKSLNTARKIYWRQNKEANIEPKILAMAYHNVGNIWSYFQNSCDFGESGSLAHRQAVYSARDITAQVNQEITDLTHH